MKKITLLGLEIVNSEAQSQNDQFEQVKVYELLHTRSTKELVEIECNDEDVIELVFEDGTEWISGPEDIQNIIGLSSNTRGSSGLNIPSEIIDVESKTGILIKIVRFFIGRKNLTKKINPKIAELWDNKILGKNGEGEGLFRLTQQFELSKFVVDQNNKDKYLVFIHGFSNDIKGSFKDIYNNRTGVLWQTMRALYGNNILAFEHKTISKSPIVNAIDLLSALPNGAKIDILSQSRGGLVADLIARCNIENDILFDSEDFKLLKKYGNEEKELKKLDKLARKKKIVVGKVIRASAPGLGTTLLKKKRLDHFLNGVLTAIGFAVGDRLNPLYQIVKGVLKEVVSSKSDPESFPGIAAMVPDSDYQKMINRQNLNTKDELIVIEGDADVGRNVKQTILVILTNLFYQESNDFVINTASMRFGAIREKGVHTFLSKDSNTTHFSYFKNQNTIQAIFRALVWDGKEDLAEFEYFTREELLVQISSDKDESTARGQEELSFNRSGDKSSRSKRVEKREIDLVEDLFGLSMEEESLEKVEITIAIYHGNLKFSNAPVMIGHFAGDPIVSAEKALDNALSNQLSDRMELGNYPSSIRDNIVLCHKTSAPFGAVIIGLGEKVEFNEFELRKAVTNGILAYGIFLKENNDYLGSMQRDKISSVIIGSDYAKMDVESALTSILIGISNANDKIQEFNKQRDPQVQKIQPIKELVLFELYEHRAKEAYFALQSIEKSNINLRLNLPPTVKGRKGGLKKVQYQKDRSWWNDLLTEKIKDEGELDNTGLRFIYNEGKAKVQDTVDYFSQSLVEDILSDFSRERRFNKTLSNSLFNLLIPNKIKSVIRNQSNISWKMTKETAAYPWEMIHDKEIDKDPTFVNVGLVRQLVTQQADSPENLVRKKSSLIIGDPIYKKFSQLPYAQKEAEELGELINNLEDWPAPHLLINKRRIEIVNALLNEKYKILHIAGHGVYEPKTEKTGVKAGIVVGDSILDSKFFNKLPNIPEFVFINCCYSGDIDDRTEKNYENRYKLSASLGMHLIEMGVQAVIITGWAVDDKAAGEFAREFYKKMLEEGEEFGKAAQKARKRIYDLYGHSNNTWGAYQCYGNPWYRLTNKNTKAESRDKYLSEEEVLNDLYNIKAVTHEKSKKDLLVLKAKEILRRAEEVNLDKSMTFQKIAEIYADLDSVEEALDFYKKMQNQGKADYTVGGLEQYCNLLVKKSFANFRNGQALSASNRDRHIGYFKVLIDIAPTSERYSILGSAYKRYTIMFPKLTEKYLKEMAERYEQAYEIEKEQSADIFTYPFSNLILAKHFLGESKTKYQEKINETVDILRPEEEEYENFWEDIALINMLTVQIALGDEKDKMSEIAEEIKTKYAKVFTKGGTLKNLRSEIEHFDFIITMYEKGYPKKEKINLRKLHLKLFLDIKSELEKLL